MGLQDGAPVKAGRQAERPGEPMRASMPACGRGRAVLLEKAMKFAWRWMRLVSVRVVVAAVAAAAAGCASLPQDVHRPASQALPAAAGSTLARILQASSPDPALSGLRLMSWSAQALSTRIELARRAEHSLDLQYYVIHDDETGRYLLRALRDAALRGVRVGRHKAHVSTPRSHHRHLAIA